MMITFDDPGIEPDSLIESIKAKFGESLEVSISESGMLIITTSREHIKRLCKFMRDELGFEHIIDLAGVDYRKNFEVVYHLCSYKNHCIAQVKVDIPTDEPTIDTVSDIWGGANWHEREAYDMFGIIFKDHPNLKRILLPIDSTFFPLRKSYKLKKESVWNVEKPQIVKKEDE